MLNTYSAQMNPMGDCETTIGGRRVEISLYNWTVEDSSMAPSGDAGTHYRAVARFLTSGSWREVFVSIQSNMRSDVMSYRQLFWTADFGGSPAPAGVASVADARSVASPGVSPTSAAQTSTSPCIAKADPMLPAADAVLDTALVQTLIASAGPAPRGFAVMALEFDRSGALAGISVAQSDLPDPAQRQIATLIASNLKAHETRTSASYMLRVDAGEAGLRFAVQPACAP
jgi:hypothetical protein